MKNLVVARPAQKLKSNKRLALASRIRQSKGFTLIEIMLVLAIIAAVAAFGLSRIRKNENNIRSVARNLIVLTKEIRNQARMTSSTLRLVVQFDRKSPKYWVEKASGIELRNSEEDKNSTDDKDQPKSSFQIFKTLTKKEKELPKGFYFNSLEITNQTPINEGYGFIYFSPEGFVDASALQISDEKKTWTFVFNPLTGHADFLPEAKSLKDISR